MAWGAPVDAGKTTLASTGRLAPPPLCLGKDMGVATVPTIP